MAAHLRSQLRLAVATLLTGAVTVDGNVVAVSRKRVHAIAEDQLPAAFVVMNGEEADSENTRKPFLNNVVVDFEIQLAVADPDNTGDVDDLADDGCKQIQHLIAGAALAGAKWIKYRGTRLDLDEQNQNVMRADLRFTAYFIAAENAVDVAL